MSHDNIWVPFGGSVHCRRCVMERHVGGGAARLTGECWACLLVERMMYSDGCLLGPAQCCLEHSCLSGLGDWDILNGSFVWAQRLKLSVRYHFPVWLNVQGHVEMYYWSTRHLMRLTRGSKTFGDVNMEGSWRCPCDSSTSNVQSHMHVFTIV